jgi:competence protein ComEC
LHRRTTGVAGKPRAVCARTCARRTRAGHGLCARREKLPRVSYGQRIEVTARVRTPHNFGNPGAFDYAHYLGRKKIFWTASARGAEDLKPLPGSCASKVLAAIYRVRSAALERLEQLYPGNGYTSAMMQALLLGEESKVEKVWVDDYRRTGTYHALVISGSHVMVVAGVLLFFLRICFVPRGWALCLTALAAWIYAVMSGWGAPVIRAAAGLSIFAVAKLLYREGRVLNVLAAVAITTLAADPEQLFEASFQLSFLSVAAIGALAAPLLERRSEPFAAASRGLAKVSRDVFLPPRVAQIRVELRLLAETTALWLRIPQSWIMATMGRTIQSCVFVFDLTIVSAAVQLSLALPMIFYFHRIAATSISANLLIVPALSAAVPIGFLAVITKWKWLAAIAGMLLEGAKWGAALDRGWEPSWRIADPPVWAAIVFAAIVMLAAALAIHRPLFRRAAAVFAITAFVFLGVYRWSPLIQRGWLELTAVDVGQGDGLLACLPDGRTMLIDGGGVPVFDDRAKPKLDVGEDVVSPYLWRRRITSVDVVVLTHAHHDHAGGLSALIENFHPKELWTGATPESPVWAAVRDKAREFGVKIVSRRAGENFQYGGVHIDVLAPASNYIPRANPHNNDSLVMLLTHGSRRVLLTGDVERQVEQQMLERVRPVDVLKVAHHGSKTSSTEEFLTQAHPAVALVSAGVGNMYRHPHPEIVKRFEANHTALFRTDQSGLISIRTDGRRLEVQTHEWGIPENPFWR